MASFTYYIICIILSMVVKLRLRNVKNKEQIINNSEFIELNPSDFKGKWNKVFGNNNPICLEIGTGKGKFLINKAIENPNINYIGIEKYDSVIVRALENVNKELTNIKFIRMNASDVDSVFDKEIECIYLNFSDPWPKKRHSIRRLTSSLFLEKYDKVFKDKKTIYQRTDNKELFEFSIVSLNKEGYLIDEISFDLHNSLYFDNITTEYEDRFSSKGNNIYYLKAEKK